MIFIREGVYLFILMKTLYVYCALYICCYWFAAGVTEAAGLIMSPDEPPIILHLHPSSIVPPDLLTERRLERESPSSRCTRLLMQV